jgi:hypothetical protein
MTPTPSGITAETRPMTGAADPVIRPQRRMFLQAEEFDRCVEKVTSRASDHCAFKRPIGLIP